MKVLNFSALTNRSEMVISKNVLSCDDSLETAVGRVDDHHVPAVIDPELLQHPVELVVHAHRQRAFNHIRSQVNPLFRTILDDILENVCSVRLGREYVHQEMIPSEHLVSGCLWESILFIVLEVPLIDRSRLLTGVLVLQKRSFLAVVIQTVLHGVRVTAHHLRSVNAILVIEGLLFEELDDDALGD